MTHTPLRLPDARKRQDFTFVDLFAGIGGIRLAFDAAGGRCVYTSEWNSHAQKTYSANFGDHALHGDITVIDPATIPDHDVLVAGFPCQPFSIAGVSKKASLGRDHGFLDQAQGTLFFDIARIIAVKRPRAFFLENVKNITSHDKGRTFKVIREVLTSLGYSFNFQVVDAKYYVPQHRERAFMVGFDTAGGRFSPDFKFPQYPVDDTNLPKLRDIVQRRVDSKYTLSDNLWTYLQNYASKHAAAGNGFGFGLASLSSYSRTLSARYYKDGSEILIAQKGKNPRRLTPRECARLQGFPDSFEIVVSDNQAYKQFGNSVAVPAVRATAEAMRPYIKAMQAYEKLFPRAQWADVSEFSSAITPPAKQIVA